MSVARSISFVLSSALIASGAVALASRPSAARTGRASIEYKAVPVSAETLASASAQQKLLDENGKDGWQLVMSTPVSFVFRR